jgi:sulfur carrier protein ThiS
MPGLFGAFVHVQVRFRPRRQPDRAVELPAGATAETLLEAVGESPVNMVVVRAGVPITDDEPLIDGEELLLFSAASGG